MPRIEYDRNCENYNPPIGVTPPIESVKQNGTRCTARFSIRAQDAAMDGNIALKL
jgi:hypothetical protein